MTESQLLEDINIMEEELIHNDNDDQVSDKDTPKSNNSYHKLPSLESIIVYVINFLFSFFLFWFVYLCVILYSEIISKKTRMI